MRHGKKVNHLGRTASHRSAMLSNMASSLILHKRINTTLAKAKALRKYVEPLLTKAKDDSTNSRRVVFSYLQNKETIKELFGVVAEKIAARPGGYTRILKTGTRLGDSAEMCMMELVDFNELMLQEAKPKKARRSRRAGSGKASESKSETTVAEVEEAEVIVDETVVEDTTETVAEEQKEEKSEEVKGAAEDAGDSTTDEGTEDSDKPKA